MWAKQVLLLLRNLLKYQSELVTSAVNVGTWPALVPARGATVASSMATKPMLAQILLLHLVEEEECAALGPSAIVPAAALTTHRSTTIVVGEGEDEIDMTTGVGGIASTTASPTKLQIKYLHPCFAILSSWECH